MRRAAALWLLAPALACSAPGPPAATPAYVPSRHDYRAFRARHPELLEPNYLPFMVHPLSTPDGGARLLLCRWEERQMPLAVHLRAPPIPEALQDEFARKRREHYVEAVEAALARWERELEGLVRFRRVERARDAAFSLALLPEQAPAPAPDLQVLGRTPVARACRARAPSAGDERVDVVFEVPEVKVYLADRFGLLDAEQVEWIALHEIGHALGMRGHSPIPADLMYEVVRDSVIVGELSVQDVNSFVSLYRLPNGTVLGRVPVSGSPAPGPPQPPDGPPRLELAPHVDPRLGFSWRPPEGWLRIETPQGVAAVDGVSWDYGASFQIIVQRYPTVQAYLERYGSWYLGRGRVLENHRTALAGRDAVRIVVDDGRGRVEHLVFAETGDGRVVVVVADCPSELADAYRPWFEASLGSLRIWDARGADDSAGPWR